MPKMLETYNPFGGGINSKDDARDIAKNELVDCLNIMVDSVGRVRSSPTTATADTGTDTNFAIDRDREAHNLFTWTADANWDDDSWNGEENAPLNKRQFIVMYDSVNCEVDMWPQKDHDNFMTLNGYGDGSSGITIDLGTNTDANVGFATFYAAENALRIMNGNYRDNIGLEMRWFGFIDKTYFPYNGNNGISDGDSMLNTASKWFQDNNNLPAPGAGVWSTNVIGTAATGGSSSNTVLILPSDIDGTIASEFNTTVYRVVDTADRDHINLTNSSGNTNTQLTFSNDNGQSWSGRSFSIHPPDGKGFCVDINVTSSTDSMWKNGEYEIGQSFIYVGNQESNVVPLIGGNLTLAEDEYPQTTVTLTAGAIAPSTPTGYHPRIIGGRIYTRRADVGASWRLLVDLSFERGSRISLNHGFDVYNFHGDTGSSNFHIGSVHYLYTNTYNIKAPNPDTFQSINGYDPEQPSHHMGGTGFGAKAAVVANQRVFLGNVKHKDETGTTTVHSDRVLFSPVGKYDIFPSNHYIDIGLGDGDDIVNILETSDRLLVFKKKKLFVVNIGAGNDAGWFIEGEYPHKGINNKAAAFKTDLGCVWANNNGCYMFDGRQVADLTEKLDDDIWSDFIGTGRAVVGYVPKKDQIIVVKDARMTASTHNETYIYDMRTRSWVRNDSIIGTTGTNKGISNFQIHNNELIYAVQSSSTESVVKKILTASAAQKMQFVTKDEDFGQPGLKKKFYKIYVNYRNNDGSNQHLVCKYSLNGVGKSSGGDPMDVDTARTTYQAFGTTQSTIATDPATWKIATFEASSPIEGQSISLYFDTDNGSGTLEACSLDINEVTIEWRPLRQRAST